MTPSRLFPFFAPALAVLVAVTLTPLASAQPIIVDDFEDGIGPGEFIFAGGEPGMLSITSETLDGSTSALQFDVDADDYGDFTGFGQPIQGGPLDISGVQDGVLVFDAAATGTFNLEINLQNTGGGGEGEIRNVLRFANADGTYKRYRLSLASFLPTNAAVFDLDDVAQYVWTVGPGAAGDGSGATMETQIRIDNVQIQEGLGFNTVVSAYDFDDGDFSDTNGFFYFAGGEGITAAATTDTPDGSANGFSGTIDGDEYGDFAGLGSTFVGAPLDVTSQESFNFWLRTNGPATMEVNLQTDAAAGGNEGREVIRVGDTGGVYQRYSIPLEAFVQSSANAPNLSSVFNFVFTFVQLPGDGDTGSTEFAFDLDGLGFGTQTTAVSNELPPSLADAPSVFPNPTAGTATVAFELTTPSALRVDVFDVLGRQVATLADGEQAAGSVRLGVPSGTLTPGTYLVRVQTEAGIATTRLTVVR